MSLSTSALGEDEELRQFIATKELQNQLTAQVHHLTNICFDKCIDSSGSLSDLSSRHITCLQNCTQRFLDCSKLITERTIQRFRINY